MLLQPKLRSSESVLKKCQAPFVFDTVEENVRSRVLFPFAIFLLYIILVFAVFAPTLSSPEPVQVIKTMMPFTSVYFFGQNFSTIGSKPRARALTKDVKTTPYNLIKKNAAVSNITMHAQMADIITDPSQPVPICDGDTRTALLGSLEYIRLEEVCRIVGFQVNIKTTDTGTAEFDMNIQRGPQGIYGVRYYVAESGTKSEEDFIYIQSNVASLYVDPNSYPPASQQIGIPFTTQPKVRVLDQNGVPLSDRYVVAFTWPEPVFDGAPTTDLIQAYKYAYLTGDISNITDSDGWATFQNLAVVGSTFNYVNIFFACEGRVVARWGPEVSALVNDYKLPVYFAPIKLTSTVDNVTVVGTVSSTVMEGVALSAQPTIKVVNASGNPVANKMVFAVITALNDDVLPSGYIRSNASSTTKFLLRPIAGTYSVNFTDIFTENKYFTPLMTGTNGQLKFKDLAFSVRGAVGRFQVSFIADGVYSDPITIFVTTSVARIRIINQLAAYILLEQGENVQNDLSLIFQVVDANENGVAGKTPTVELFDPTGGLWSFSDFSMSVITDPKGYAPTDSNGVMQLLFSVDVARNQLSFGRFAITVDGLKVYSSEFRVEAKTQRKTCGLVKSIQFGPTPITSSKQFQAKYLVVDEFGDPLANAQVNLFLSYVAWGPTPVPPAGFPLLTGGGSSTSMVSVVTDSKGIASFDDVKLSGGSYGHYYILAVVKSALNPDTINLQTDTTTTDGEVDTTNIDLNAPLDNLDTGNLSPPSIPSPLDDPSSNYKYCQSSETRFLFQSLIENFNYITPATTSFADTPYQTGTLHNVVLQATNRKNKPIANQAVTVDITALQIPLYFGGRSTIDKLIKVKALSNQTDAQGQITVTINITEGSLGKFVINFKTDGSFTQPYFLTTEFKPATITVETPFAIKNSGTVARVGDFLDAASIKVVDASSNPLKGVTVIAVIDRTSPDSQYQKVLHDIADYYADSFTDITGFRSAITDELGVASFAATSVLDARGTSCIRFNFFVGEPDQFIVTTGTSGSPLCFSNDMTVSIKDLSYSTYVAQDNPFPTPLGMTIQRPSQSDSEKKGVMMFVASPLLVNDNALYKPPTFQNLYFDNAQCLYVKQTLIKRLKGKCSPKIAVSSKANEAVSYSIDFTKLTWIQAARDVTFSVSLSTPLNYPLSYNKRNDSSYASFIEIMDGSNSILNFYTQYTVEDLKKMSISEVQSLNYELFKNVTDSASLQYALSEINKNWVSIPQAATSETITVTNVPGAIQIFIQPASTVYVGDPFQVTIKATISSGAPAARVYINAGVQASTDLIADSSSSIELMFSLAQGKQSINELSGLNSKKNILLDPNTVSARTNEKGIAYFTLRIIAGIPGQYTLTFEAGKVKSPSSDKFNLLNHIGNVDWVRNVGGTVEVTKGKMGSVYSTLPIQPILQLTYSDYQTSVRKNIQVKIYKYSANKNFILNKAQSYAASLAAPDSESAGGSEQLSQLLSVISQGGMFQTSSKKDEGLAYVYSYPEETADAQLVFSGVKIKFKKAGTFVAVFAIDGIESPPSGVITVKEVALSIGERIANVLDYIVLIAIAIFVLIANSSHHEVWWIAVAIVGIAAGYAFVIETDDDDPFYMTLLIICLTLMFFALLEVIYQLKKRKRDKKSKFTFLMRRDLSIEYVYQILNDRPSQRWLDYIDQDNYDYLVGKIATNDEPEQIDEARIREISNMFKEQKLPQYLTNAPIKLTRAGSSSVLDYYVGDDATPAPLNPTTMGMQRQKSKAIKETPKPPVQNEKEEEKEAMIPPSPIAVHKIINGNDIKKSIKRDLKSPPEKKLTALKAVFTSVYSNYKKPIIKEFFFFPQKVIAGVFISMVSVAYIAYKVFLMIESARISISNVGVSVRNAYTTFMANAMSSLFESKLGMTFEESVFQSQQNIVDFVAEQFNDISTGISVAFNISAAVSCILFIASQLGMLVNFRSRILNLRKGVYDGDYKGPNTLQIKLSTQFIGFCIANSAFSWVLFTLVIGIALTPLTLPIFWKLIAEFLPIILPLLVTPIIKGISMTLIKKSAINPKTGVVNRRIWSIFEIYMFLLSIAAGVVTAIVRFIVLLVVSLFALIRMERPLFAAWALEKANGDPANITYIATVYNHHQHNNPVLLTFTFLLMDLAYRHNGKYRNVHEKQKKIISNRIHLWILMSKQSPHIDLSKYRKKNIPPLPKQLKQIEKEKLAEKGEKKNLCGKTVKMSKKEIQKREEQKEKAKLTQAKM